MIAFLHVLEASQKSHGWDIPYAKMEGFVIRGKSIDDNLDSYHVVLTMKAKDRRLRRSAKEKLSFIA